MRWKQPPRPKEGDVREKSGFLFFSKTINRETRRFEKAKWKEEFRVWDTCYIGGETVLETPVKMGGWIETEWIDD